MCNRRLSGACCPISIKYSVSIQYLKLSPAGRASRNNQNQIRLCLRSRGQRSDFSKFAVLLTQLFNFAEFDGAIRTAFHTDRLKSSLQAVKAGIALSHLVSSFVQYRCMIRASLCTKSAADALRRINDHQTVFCTFVMCFCRANLNAGRVGAVVAA